MLSLSCKKRLTLGRRSIGIFSLVEFLVGSACPFPGRYCDCNDHIICFKPSFERRCRRFYRQTPGLIKGKVVSVTSAGGAEDLIPIDPATQKRKIREPRLDLKRGGLGEPGRAGPRHCETKRTCLGPPPPCSSTQHTSHRNLGGLSPVWGEGVGVGRGY